MKSTRIYLIAMCLFVTTHGFSQDQPAPDDTGIFVSILNVNKWIEKLSQEYKELMASEKRDECLRKLGYIASDLGYIISKKQQIILLAMQPVRDKNKMTPLIQQSVLATQELIWNLREMETLVNDNLKADGNQTFSRLEDELLLEKLKTHTLMQEDVNSNNFKKLQKDTETAIALLRTSQELVWGLREKLLPTTD